MMVVSYYMRLVVNDQFLSRINFVTSVANRDKQNLAHRRIEND